MEWELSVCEAWEPCPRKMKSKTTWCYNMGISNTVEDGSSQGDHWAVDQGRP